MNQASNAELQRQIELKRGEEDKRQILTRSELKLERQLTEATEMQRDLKGLRKDIRATKGNIKRMQDLLEQMELNERDLTADLRSTLQSVHQLQLDGVSL